ncbi:MAG: class II glutamine amidotransferase, partial [Nannocystaceae bacterium]
MCRLFGFRSVMESQVHSSLVSAENALVNQSERHPDGWGVAYYVAGAPHLLRSVQTAVNDRMFQHVSGIVTSQTVLAHLRKATQGQLSVIDTHPFQYGAWAFAHNG